MGNQFNIRVYGLTIWNGKILIAEENRANLKMIKFPGGGLEFGEGLIDGLKREFKEELGIAPASFEHFYTTDFYQVSHFNKQQQVISVYYLTHLANPSTIRCSNLAIDTLQPNEMQVKWIALEELKEEIFTFPIDRYVVNLLKKELTN